MTTVTFFHFSIYFFITKGRFALTKLFHSSAREDGIALMVFFFFFLLYFSLLP